MAAPMGPLPPHVQLCLPKSHAFLPGPFSRPPLTPSYSTSTPDGSTPFPLDAYENPFVVIHPSFLDILGPAPSLRVISSSSKGESFAHEAGVWMEEQQAVWFTSNLIREDSPEGRTYRNQISYICPREVVDHRTEDNWTNVDDVPDVVTANGAIRFGKNLLVCSQGLREIPSSLSLISRDEDGHRSSQVILNNFHGRQFNSINDVAILPPPSLDPVLPHPTTNREDLHLEPHTTIFFTDPTYGHAQGYKNPPELPNQVYAFDPTTGDIRVVADGFSMPNGIAFDFEGDKCYITDTGVIDGRGGVDGSRPGTIYVYDVVRPCISQLEIAGPTLHNRRVFAFTDAGAPDGIKCDTTGNVYSGCSDGIQVWNSHGTLLGKILLQPSRTGEEGEGNKMGGNLKSRGCANFCFVPGGRLVVLAEDRMYEVRLDGERVKGALLV